MITKFKIFNDVISSFITKPIPIDVWNYYNDDDSNPLLDWIGMYLKPTFDWCTCSGILESAELLYERSLENGNIKTLINDEIRYQFNIDGIIDHNTIKNTSWITLSKNACIVHTKSLSSYISKYLFALLNVKTSKVSDNIASITKEIIENFHEHSCIHNMSMYSKLTNFNIKLCNIDSVIIKQNKSFQSYLKRINKNHIKPINFISLTYTNNGLTFFQRYNISQPSSSLSESELFNNLFINRFTSTDNKCRGIGLMNILKNINESNAYFELYSGNFKISTDKNYNNIKPKSIDFHNGIIYNIIIPIFPNI